MTTLIYVAPPRPAVNPRQTTDRFAPVVAQRLRFNISACTSLQPCLDELEVFTSEPEPRNIALASAGTKATASSTLPDSPMHRLEHINDGRYGNSHSWISNEEGRGWIELEFSQPQKIDRVVWGRDREEKFADRLATDYRIEVADASGTWHTVAGSQDRRKYEPGDKKPAPFSLAGLNANEAKEATRLLAEKKSMATEIASLSAGLMVYAGSFTNADVTHVLHRGDPEQPGELVAPAVLTALGSVTLPADAAEQERRVALASWIASPENPLTARVMVNRIWQGHFGIGLVETPSDFGHSGSPPSHPELLDWLAGEFIRSGWSIKHMHRLILLSATFRQSSRIDRASQAIDADARLLWRFPLAPAGGGDDPRFHAVREWPVESENGRPGLQSVRRTRRTERLSARRILQRRRSAAHDLRAQGPPGARGCLRRVRLSRRRPEHPRAAANPPRRSRR